MENCCIIIVMLLDIIIIINQVSESNEALKQLIMIHDLFLHYHYYPPLHSVITSVGFLLLHISLSPSLSYLSLSRPDRVSSPNA